MSEDYSIAHHDEKMWFLTDCRYHILLGDLEERLQKLDALCLTYQYVDCLYTLFNYRFTDEIVAQSGQVFDNVQGAVHSNQRTKGVDRMPSIGKKGLLKKKYRKQSPSSFPQTK